jgi:hypothetical protein
LNLRKAQGSLAEIVKTEEAVALAEKFSATPLARSNATADIKTLA